MKLLRLFCAIALAGVDGAIQAVEIPEEHVSRFLRQQISLEEGLRSWKASKAGLAALANGYYSDTDDSGSSSSSSFWDQLKRFYLTLLSIAEAKITNPSADFTVFTPFTLMTDAEFSAFVKKSLVSQSAGTVSPGSYDVDSTSNSDAGTRLLADMNTTASSSSGSSATASVNWTESGCVAPVKEQGNCGDCWAFASIGALESAYCLQNGNNLTLFSEQQVTSCDTQSSGCDGGWQLWGLEYLQNASKVCTAASYPYTSGTSGDTGTCATSSCSSVAVQIASIEQVDQSEAALISALSSQPVAVGVAASNGVWKQYSGGVISSCPTTDVDHALLAVGFTEDAFILKNQWGSAWGEDGYIRVQRDGGNTACSLLNSHNVYPVLA